MIRAVVTTAFLSGLLISGTLGCDSGQPGEHASATEPTAASAYARGTGSADRFRTIDDEFADLVNEVPGFGGLYYGADGALNVLLVDESQAAVARTAIPAFLDRRAGRGARRRAVPLRFQRANYDFRQLKRWDTLLSTAMSWEGVTQTDIDDARNKLVIGVMNRDALNRVASDLRRSGIPSNAFSVEVIPQTEIDPAIELASAPSGPTATTLQDRYRPVIGGLQIGFPNNTACTLNSNLYRVNNPFYPVPGPSLDTSERYFLTNSHCTDTFASVDGRVAGQPLASDRIGVEVYDPALFTNSQNSECPAGRSCRWSDAAVFRYDSGVSVSFARIAKTANGSLNITGQYTIIGAGHSAFFFENATPISKVGRTTGTSSDVVIRACVRTNQFSNGLDTGRTMLCQTQSNYNSSGGDSGSSVFGRSTATDPNIEVFLDGIHWGTARDLSNPSAPVLRTMSAMNWVGRDLYESYGLVFAVCSGISASGNCYAY